MGDDPKIQRSEADADIEREIREGRKFNAQEALARMAGPGAMKGASPVSPVVQAETAVGSWLRENVGDPSGALQMLLQRNLRGNELLLSNIDRPLDALAEYCRRILGSDYLLGELVRQADVEWGERMDERPHFDRQGGVPDADDPYTLESVSRVLNDILKQLESMAL